MAKSFHKGQWTVQLRNAGKLRKDLDDIKASNAKAVKATVSDMRARAPGAIASCVTAIYNIKKSEITPASGKSEKPKKMAGSIRVSGETIDEMTITYTGRMLTPTHFGMTPKTPPKGKKYTLKQQVIKGESKVIGRYLNTRTPGGPYAKRSHNILMGTGAKSVDKVAAIPFQRMSENRTDLRKFTTISMPQMITSDRVAPSIKERLSNMLRERLDHHMKRQLGTK
ncbi:MAG: serine/arginine repetitive matrix protein 2 [Candidatus Dehalobacter alkaniphilus]